MAAVMRLRRMGAPKKPFYRIVVTDSKSPRQGKYIEKVGWYDPMKDPRRSSSTKREFNTG